MLNATPDLFPEVSAKFLPAGFEYRADLIDRAEEADLVAAIEALDLAPYEFRGVKARRRVVSFGFEHGYQSRGLQVASEVPAFLHDLRARAAAFATLHAALLATTRMLAPILPFVTESMYGNLAADLADGSRRATVAVDEPGHDSQHNEGQLGGPAARRQAGRGVN